VVDQCNLGGGGGARGGLLCSSHRVHIGVE
jgi:hypothetical protein